MSARKFGSYMLTANTNTIVMTGQQGYDSTVNVVFCNQNVVTAYVQLAYLDDSNLQNMTVADIFLYKQPLPIQSRFEIKGLAIESTKSLVAMSDQGQVSVLVYGFEESQN